MKSYSPEVITYPVFQPMQLRQINWQLDSKMVFSFKLNIKTMLCWAPHITMLIIARMARRQKWLVMLNLICSG